MRNEGKGEMGWSIHCARIEAEHAEQPAMKRYEAMYHPVELLYWEGQKALRKSGGWRESLLATEGLGSRHRKHLKFGRVDKDHRY